MQISEQCTVYIRDILGHGGYGHVYKGKYELDNQTLDVAVKRITFEDDNDESDESDGGSKKVAIKEVDIYSTVKKAGGHENIATFYGSVLTEDSYWIVLELCELGDLEQYMQSRCLYLHEKISLMKDCARALHFLHCQQKPALCHGDIKPANILVKKVNEKNVAKLCDFTGSGEIGTKDFRPPRVYKSSQRKHQDGISDDVYALGLVFNTIVSCNERGMHSSLPETDFDAEKSKILLKIKDLIVKMILPKAKERADTPQVWNIMDSIKYDAGESLNKQSLLVLRETIVEYLVHPDLIPALYSNDVIKPWELDVVLREHHRKGRICGAEKLVEILLQKDEETIETFIREVVKVEPSLKGVWESAIKHGNSDLPQREIKITPEFQDIESQAYKKLQNLMSTVPKDQKDTRIVKLFLNELTKEEQEIVLIKGSIKDFLRYCDETKNQKNESTTEARDETKTQKNESTTDDLQKVARSMQRKGNSDETQSILQEVQSKWMHDSLDSDEMDEDWNFEAEEIDKVNSRCVKMASLPRMPMSIFHIAESDQPQGTEEKESARTAWDVKPKIKPRPSMQLTSNRVETLEETSDTLIPAKEANTKHIKDNVCEISNSIENNLSFKDYFSNQLTKSTEMNIGDISHGIAEVQGEIWVPLFNMNIVEIYNKSAQLVQTVNVDTPGSVVEACNSQVFIASHEDGLHVMCDKNDKPHKLCAGRFSSVRRYGDKVYALKYEERVLIEFGLSDKGKISEPLNWTKFKTIQLWGYRYATYFDTIVVTKCNKQLQFYISSWDHDTIHQFNENGRPVKQYGGSREVGIGNLYRPLLCCIDKDSVLLVADCGNKKIKLLDTVSGEWSLAPINISDSVCDVRIDSDGSLWIIKGDKICKYIKKL